MTVEEVGLHVDYITLANSLTNDTGVNQVADNKDVNKEVREEEVRGENYMYIRAYLLIGIY